jgi:hypothetical protein
MLNSFTNSKKEYGVIQVFWRWSVLLLINNIDAYAVNTDWKKVFFRQGKTSSQDGFIFR